MPGYSLALALAFAMGQAMAADLPPATQDRLNAAVRERMRPKWEELYPEWVPKVEKPKKAVARKGPVEITLEIVNTTVRSHKRVNLPVHSLWLRVTLRNVGKKPFKVSDGAFQSLLDLEDHGNLRYEIVGADGAAVVRNRLGGSELERPEACPKPAPNQYWEKLKPPFTLEPGETVSTPQSHMRHVVEVACLGRPNTSPLPPYGEVLGLMFGENRRARIRLIYDHSIPAKYLQHLKRQLGPEEVAVATDWIDLEIAP